MSTKEHIACLTDRCPHLEYVALPSKSGDPVLYVCSKDGEYYEWEHCAGCLGVDPEAVEVEA